MISSQGWARSKASPCRRTILLWAPQRAPDTALRTSALTGRKSLKQRLGLESWLYLPEPLDDRVVGAVAVLVNGVLSPIIHVHITKAAHQQLGRKLIRCKPGGTRRLRALPSHRPVTGHTSPWLPTIASPLRSETGPTTEHTLDPISVHSICHVSENTKVSLTK